MLCQSVFSMLFQCFEEVDVNNLKKSLSLLFNRHVTVTERMKRHLKPNCRILDFKCGRRLLCCFLAMKNFDVYSADASVGILKIMEKLAEKLGCKPRFRLIKENNLPFVNEYFDVLLCVWVLHEVSHDEIQKYPKNYIEYCVKRAAYS